MGTKPWDRMSSRWLFGKAVGKFVKKKVLDMFKEFYEQNSFIKRLNNTFLVLLLKKEGLRTWVTIDPLAC